MKIRERLAIYGALALLLVLNLATLSGGGAAALAEPTLMASDLGPAASLTLLDDEDAELVLRNRGGRLSWAESGSARAMSIGFVHVGRAVGPLLESEQYVEEMQTLEAEIIARAQELDEQINAFLQENQNVEPDDPEAPQLQQIFEQMRREQEQWMMEGRSKLAQLAANQIGEAYTEFLAAVDVVAEEKDIDLVIRFIPRDVPFEAVNPQQAYTGIRGRIALKYPDGVNITDAVLEELGLEN